MALINLATKYSDKIQEKFQAETFLHGKLNGDYSFEGVKSVTIYTPITKPMTNYTRSGLARFGTPTDVEDHIQTFTMTQDRAVSLIIDKANNSDQMKIKAAAKIMNLQIKEQAGPEMDKYGFKIFSLNAGIANTGTQPVKGDIVTYLSTDLAAMDNALVPDDGQRFVYMPVTQHNQLRLSTEYMAVDPIAAKVLGKGVVGEFMNAKIVKVPDNYFPTNVWYLIVHQRCAFLPMKLETLRILTEVQGVDGAVLELHQYYDAFVIGAKASGVLVRCAAALKVGATTITPTGASHAITNATGSAVIYYTLDGSDPRYSATRVLYTGAVTLTSGQTIKAAGTKADMVNGDVASAYYA